MAETLREWAVRAYAEHLGFGGVDGMREEVAEGLLEEIAPEDRDIEVVALAGDLQAAVGTVAEQVFTCDMAAGVARALGGGKHFVILCNDMDDPSPDSHLVVAIDRGMIRAVLGEFARTIEALGPVVMRKPSRRHQAGQTRRRWLERISGAKAAAKRLDVLLTLAGEQAAKDGMNDVEAIAKGLSPHVAHVVEGLEVAEAMVGKRRTRPKPDDGK